MTNAFETCLENLTHLSDDQLKQLQARITALRQFSNSTDIASPDNTKDGGHSIVLDAIIEFFASKGQHWTAAQIRRHANYPSFRDVKAPALMAYVRETKLSKNEQRALLSLGIELLYGNMQKIGVPITPTVLMNSVHRIPAIFDLHYPGYYDSGLLSMIVKRGQATGA